MLPGYMAGGPEEQLSRNGMSDVLSVVKIWIAKFRNNTVLWSSWLWRLLYTQNVPSSILGRARVVFRTRTRGPAHRVRRKSNIFSRHCAGGPFGVQPARCAPGRAHTRTSSSFFQALFFAPYRWRFARNTRNRHYTILVVLTDFPPVARRYTFFSKTVQSN